KEEYMGLHICPSEAVIHANNLEHYNDYLKRTGGVGSARKEVCDRKFDDYLTDEQFLHRMKQLHQKEEKSKPSTDAEVSRFDGFGMHVMSFFKAYQDYTGPPFEVLLLMYRAPHMLIDAHFLLRKILSPISKGITPDVEDWWTMYANYTKEEMIITPRSSGINSI